MRDHLAWSPFMAWRRAVLENKLRSRRHRAGVYMKTLTASSILWLVAALDAPGARAADPNAALVKPHGGKVWVQVDPFPPGEGNRLGDYLGGKKPAAEVAARKKDAPWEIHYLAVFKKPAIKGPMTVQFYEQTDPRNIVDQYSPIIESPALVFQNSYELSPDVGFNKGRTYVIRVGQILKKKFVPYASGIITLK
jgi:hypothetical protein